METAVDTHDFAVAPINKNLSIEEKHRFLREMLRIRQFETVANKWSKWHNGPPRGVQH